VVLVTGLTTAPLAWAQVPQGARANARSELPQSDVEAIELKLFNVTQSLLQDPQNPELLLQKGIHLSALGRLQDAFDVFEALRANYPNHPAPYANLASVYARWGKLEEARQMLLKSDALQGNRFQTQLSLASVNLELALAALNKANQINPGDRTTELKLRALEKYLSDANKSTFPTNSMGNERAMDSGARRIPQDMAPSSTAKPRVIEAVTRKKDRLSLTALEADDVNKPQATQSTQTGGATAAAATTGNSSGDAVPDVRRQEVVKTLESWAKSWTNRSYSDYAALYATSFQPSDGSPKEAWFKRKQALMEKNNFIQVELKVSSIRFSGDKATVQLTQRYKSDRYTDTSRKELVLSAEDGTWKILREKASH
jgi:tetratricopeptide (TPR) repeat protein